MANMIEADEDEKKRRAQDMALLTFDPYFLTRALALFFFELGRELWQAWQQKRHDVQPRLNRMEEFYPFVRAAMCSLMREISANLAMLDMMRGAPAIYMLYLGYDEVAHHSGPWTNDAFGDLKRLDKTFAHIQQVVDGRKRRDPTTSSSSRIMASPLAPPSSNATDSPSRSSSTATAPGTTVAAEIGGDRGAMGLQGMAGELSNVSDSDGVQCRRSGAGQAGEEAGATGRGSRWSRR